MGGGTHRLHGEGCVRPHPGEVGPVSAVTPGVTLCCVRLGSVLLHGPTSIDTSRPFRGNRCSTMCLYLWLTNLSASRNNVDHKNPSLKPPLPSCSADPSYPCLLGFPEMSFLLCKWDKLLVDPYSCSLVLLQGVPRWCLGQCYHLYPT